MVKKDQLKVYKDYEGGPPPLDEAWWESVLTDKHEVPNKQGEHNLSIVEQNNPKNSSTSYETDEEIIDWSFACKLFQEDQTINLHVIGYNKGGLLVSGENIQGFVPVSHLLDLPCEISPDEQEKILSSYLNRQLKLKVIECDQERGRIVFSERAALADSGVRKVLFNQLKADECVWGTVTNVTDFGAFVDLGGVEGLVHVSEISWGRVHHPADVVRVGDRVQVYVIAVDVVRSRVALSLKRMCPNPWDTAGQRYYPGQVTEATITSIVPYGAFARVEEGLDGLIHITEIDLTENEDLSKILIEGQHVKVRVINVDATKQRLGLSLVANS